MRDLLKAKISYNNCTNCGRVPETHLDEPNYAPLRYYDRDDGWCIGTLCRWCWNEVRDRTPHPNDVAYQLSEMLAKNVGTDEIV